MVFNRFRRQLLWRVLLLSGNLLLSVFLYFRTDYHVTFTISIVVAVSQVIALIHFVEKTERDLARFFNAIQYQDFFETFASHGSAASKELHEAFTRVIRDFQEVRSQREAQYQYLQTVIQHIGIGLIAYDRDGNIDLVNNAARKLLGVKIIRNTTALSELGTHFVEALAKISPGEQRTLKVVRHGIVQQLALHATEFRRYGTQYTLVSIQNIQRELEDKEMEAWQDLMRVLTHEIRNSITPIASLATTARGLLDECEPGEENDAEDISDARLAVKTIEKRSNGLLGFVESFRSLSHIPKPKFQILVLNEFFEHLQMFFQSQFEEKEIRSSFRADPDTLEVTADPGLLEQVMINLVMNAIQAVADTEQPSIEVQGYMDVRGRITIEVSDNGPGILDEVIDKAFIPFFTTKKEGSGIGLSLSRQIMRLHGGSIHVSSTPNIKTTFRLTF